MNKLLKNKPLLIMLAAIVLLAVLVALTVGSRQVTAVESALGSVVQPVQGFAAKASNVIINFVQRIFKTTDADKENEQLRVRLAQLEQAQAELEITKAENERLRALLNYVQDQTQYNYVTARVTGKSQGIWFFTFTLNAGRNQGVKEDMPVVDGTGLVGRVTDVGATWCKVTAAIDSGSTVSIMIERTRDNGMIRGTLDGTDSDQLELYYLPVGSDIVPGDTVVTNGIGGVFPKGLIVGTVIEVTRETEGATDTNALVTPAVDFKHLEEVVIITGTGETQTEGE